MALSEKRKTISDFEIEHISKRKGSPTANQDANYGSGQET